MPRYIDLDEINRLHPKLTAKYPLSFANGISAAVNEINRLPNSDVVPKSEVERLKAELDDLAEEHSDLIVEKDQLFDKVVKYQKAAKIANEEYEKVLNHYFIDTKMGNGTPLLRVIAEVERDIFADIKKAISGMTYNARTPRKTVKVEELKEQVDWVLHEVVPSRIEEIEKKYTEVSDA